ncbi:MAG: terminase, partial [Clostridia bacterium]|nr:terminase [Clostridia bacterium]
MPDFIYTPTPLMLPTSHYDQRRADFAVNFISMLKHTTGEWYGKPFQLMPWQEQIVRDIFGIVNADGYRQFRTAYVEVGKKNGKQLSLDTLLPTPEGFVTMGEINAGDVVFDELGQPCRVIAKSDVDDSEQAFRITFKDGAVIEAGENHQWHGEWRSANKLKSGVVTTEWLYRRSLALSRKRSLDFRIPLAEAIDTPEAALPVEPYLFGYWLGNGNATKPEITVKTDDVAAVLRNIVLTHETAGAWHNVGDSLVFRFPALREILLVSFHDKVIPLLYLRASKAQRFRLLQGLMDSDGAISTVKGQAIYTSTEKVLSESVSELLWSLGIKNAINTAPSTQRTDWTMPSAECGRELTGETLYYVKFTAFDDLPVSGIMRKRARSVPRNPSTRSHFRYIDRIEPITNPGMQCIQVDSPSRLYLAGRSCIPTHNSELAAAIALYLLFADGEAGAEVYSCAADINQASIVFNTAKAMVEQNKDISALAKLIP